MIRLIQTKLIIPRGDTGTFSVPLLASFSEGDAAIFSILDGKTKKVILRKAGVVQENVLNINFTHYDTVNLIAGKYYWDIKIYRNPEFIDNELVNGEEVDSYYAAYSLPTCEIRQTGDILLTSDHTPESIISPEFLDIFNSTISSIDSKITNLIDDTAGNDNTDKVWSAAKSTAQIQYIANHLHEPTFGEPILITDTVTLNFSKDGDNQWYISEENPFSSFTYKDFDIQSLYKIEWDGIEYNEFYINCAKPSSTNTNLVYSYYVIGNADFFGNHSAYSTIAPFAITQESARRPIQILTPSTSETHTIKITRIPFTIQEQPYRYFHNIGKYGYSLFCPGSGEDSLMRGCAQDASGASALAVGYGSTASGNVSYAEGCGTVSQGQYSHSEGFRTLADGTGAHSEGQSTIASAAFAHSEGNSTVASGTASHAEGTWTVASGQRSHAEGLYTIAQQNYQHVSGKYNVADTNGDYVEIIGNGTGEAARANARTLDWQGNERLMGDLYVHCDADSTNGVKVATMNDIHIIESYLPNDSVSGIIASFPDGAENLPLKSCIINIEPIQEGIGQPSSTNIRPITGWTGAIIVVSSTQNAQGGTTYPISWQTEVGTIYGGVLNVISGELIVNRATIAAYNGETLPGVWISDRDAYSMGTIPTTGAQVVYELATPITYHLTPIEIHTLLGQNNIWANTGNIAVTYKADIQRYINKKLAGN